MQEEGTYRDLMTGAVLELRDVPLPGHGFIWAKCIGDGLFMHKD